jgi:ectoine hydroxylase-related dioxygenase (phytanoyl-CoA dioxygenase family)
MDMATAMADLGVTKELLDQETAAALDKNGFAALPGVLSAEQVEAIVTRLAELSRVEGSSAGAEVHQEAGADRLSDLINKDPMFSVCLTDPRVLAAVRHVLGEFKFNSLNSRAALPGQGLQGLHADWGVLPEAQDYQICNSIWLLDDFTAENGATRVVPGTHRKRGMAPADELDGDPTAAHPDEVQLIAPAGTVVVFNGHVWHGGTRNDSDRPRRALHSSFVRRDQPQQTDQAEYLRVRTRDRLSPAALYLLGV